MVKEFVIGKRSGLGFLNKLENCLSLDDLEKKIDNSIIFQTRLFQILRNMEFFCKLSNLKEFNYDVSSFKNLEKSLITNVLFPKIAYFNTYYIKEIFQIKLIEIHIKSELYL